jgi:hypothetical protein
MASDEEGDRPLVIAPRPAPPIGVVPSPSAYRRPAKVWAGWLALVLGPWLLFSTWLWPHGRDARTNTLLVGMLMMGFGAVSLYVPWLRGVLGVLGAWLAVSTLVVGHVMPAAMWNDALVGFVMVVVSLIPPPRESRPAAPQLV